MNKPRVLFYTACGGSYGFGHLKRCMSIINAGNRLFDGQLLLGKGARGEVFANSGIAEGFRLLYDWKEVDHFDLIVSDQRDTTSAEMFNLTEVAPVIALDDRKGGHLHAHVTVQAMPSLDGITGNYTGSDFIVLDPAFCGATRFGKRGEGVVVSLGGTDPHDLSGLVTRALNRIGIRPILIRGPLHSHKPPAGEYELLENPKDMVGVLCRAGLVITAFGMTLYEALYLGRPVLLLNHSAYHEELARTIPGLTSLGYHGSLKEATLADRLSEALSDREGLESVAQDLSNLVDARGVERLIAVIQKSLQGGRKSCLFKHGRYVAFRRFKWGTLMTCRVCGDLFQFELENPGDRYHDKDYFLSDYERQYGKTYIEDRDHISAVGKRRLWVIEDVLRKERVKSRKGGSFETDRGTRSSGTILDVGCALGFFLEIARQQGWETCGIEISSYAARWAQEKLGLKVFEGNYLEMELAPESFDAVTFFFVAEHFKDVEKVIERAYSLLRMGGVLACALPNRGGISYRRNPEAYIDNHPRDHYVDTCPRNLMKLLKEYGFSRRNIQTTGIHPERVFSRRIATVDAMYRQLARAMRLGDTFEYYGIKT
jgi:spore coat polysaccharide biosynthesis predicted glycosyltransferase SpsG/2-polyprenyl-3-methyl-5-hydroxy-6-metoxy-1,4-benzoquinol methylase